MALQLLFSTVHMMVNCSAQDFQWNIYISIIYYHQESKTFNLVYFNLINLNVQTSKIVILEILKSYYI